MRDAYFCPPLLALGVLCVLACGEPPPRHAVLIVIDTFRADSLDNARTPHLDALAPRGQRTEVAWSASTWTLPSVISLLTGRHVRQHGWNCAGHGGALRPRIALHRV